MFVHPCAAARTFSAQSNWARAFLMSLTLSILLVGSTDQAKADVIGQFDNVNGSPSGEFGWDDFNGASYGGPHTTDQFATGIGNANMTVTPVPNPPGGIVAGNLYAFTTVPDWQVNLTGLSNANAFTSIAVQFATTADIGGGNLNASNFSMGGIAADEFIDLGVRTSIPGNGGAPTPVNFYWAEWIGESALTNYTINVSGSGGFHQVLAGTKVSYFNTTSSFNISSVPEPNSIAMLGFIHCLLS